MFSIDITMVIVLIDMYYDDDSHDGCVPYATEFH